MGASVMVLSTFQTWFLIITIMVSTAAIGSWWMEREDDYHNRKGK